MTNEGDKIICELLKSNTSLIDLDIGSERVDCETKTIVLTIFFFRFGRL